MKILLHRQCLYLLLVVSNVFPHSDRFLHFFHQYFHLGQNSPQQVLLASFRFLWYHLYLIGSIFKPCWISPYCSHSWCIYWVTIGDFDMIDHDLIEYFAILSSSYVTVKWSGLVEAFQERLKFDCFKVYVSWWACVDFSCYYDGLNSCLSGVVVLMLPKDFILLRGLMMEWWGPGSIRLVSHTYSTTTHQ